MINLGDTHGLEDSLYILEGHSCRLAEACMWGLMSIPVPVHPWLPTASVAVAKPSCHPTNPLSPAVAVSLETRVGLLVSGLGGDTTQTA